MASGSKRIELSVKMKAFFREKESLLKMASSLRRESIAAGVGSNAVCHILRQGTVFTLSYLTPCFLPWSNTTQQCPPHVQCQQSVPSKAWMAKFLPGNHSKQQVNSMGQASELSSLSVISQPLGELQHCDLSFW